MPRPVLLAAKALVAECMMGKSVCACVCELVPEVSRMEGGRGVLRSSSVQEEEEEEEGLGPWFTSCSWDSSVVAPVGRDMDGKEGELAAVCETRRLYENWSRQNWRNSISIS